MTDLAQLREIIYKPRFLETGEAKMQDTPMCTGQRGGIWGLEGGSHHMRPGPAPRGG